MQLSVLQLFEALRCDVCVKLHLHSGSIGVAMSAFQRLKCPSFTFGSTQSLHVLLSGFRQYYFTLICSQGTP